MKTSNTWLITWVIAFLGFPIGGTLALLVIGHLDSSPEGVIGGLLVGLTVGLAQMVALRSRIATDAEWVIATAIGLAAGVALSVALVGAATNVDDTLMRAPLTGLLLGLAQWIVLRKRVRFALVWLPTVTILYTLAWYITAQVIGESLDNGFVVFGSSGAIVYQLVTGLVLWMLLRLSPSPAPANTPVPVPQSAH